jgi:periplasmic protein CpxP/Spy
LTVLTSIPGDEEAVTMDFFTRTRMLIGVIILLLCMNIGMLILFLVGRPATPSRKGSSREQDREQARIEQLLREELGFDQRQIDTYLVSRRAHQNRMRALNEEMRRLKNSMFDGVLSDAPSPVLSDSLLALTREVQDKIERSTFQHLAELTKLCTPPQRETLRTLLDDLLRRKPQPDEPPPREP